MEAVAVAVDVEVLAAAPALLASSAAFTELTRKGPCGIRTSGNARIRNGLDLDIVFWVVDGRGSERIYKTHRLLRVILD